MRNPKDPHQKKKRSYRPKSKRVAAKKGQNDDSKSDAPDQGSEGSSPADGATEAELEVEDDRQRANPEMVEPELPPMHGRATSAEPVMTGTKVTSAHQPPAALETRASKSSPVRNEGSHGHPAQGDLTPKALCRQLFPSPVNKTDSNTRLASVRGKSAGPLSELPNVCRRSPRLNKSRDVPGTHPKTPVAGEKENKVSGPAQHDDLSHLFNDDDDDFQLPPQTPTPARRSSRLLLKTPSRTPSERQPRTPAAHTSPSAQRALQDAKTPKRDFIMGSNRTVEEMTPCTRLIHEHLIKEAALQNKSSAEPLATDAESPPTRQPDLDFPDLPELQEISPISRQFASLDNTDLSSFNTDFPDIFRTTIQGSSSPPNGYYNFSQL